MSRILCKVGGGGGKAPKGDAIPANVLAGKTFSNKGNVGLTGTMINRGAVTATIGAGETYAIGDGYHNGNGIITAKSLASQTSGTATAADILKDKTAWVNGKKLTGSIITQAGGTYNPTTSVKTLVSGGRYVSSDVKVNAFALPPASALKKGYKYTLYGQSVTGTFEGYTTSPLYIIQNGVVKNLSSNKFNETAYDSDRKGLKCWYDGIWCVSAATFNFTPYNYLKLRFRADYYSGNSIINVNTNTITVGLGTSQSSPSYSTKLTTGTDSSILAWNITNYNNSYYIFFKMTSVNRGSGEENPGSSRYSILYDLFVSTT